MSPELIFAIVAITGALAFYSWGVFGERRRGVLTSRYVLLFWLGLACDTTGTLIMGNIARQSAVAGPAIHGIAGAVAIALMMVHAVWATYTCFKGDAQAQRRFHTFSTVVWLIWLIPYVMGVLVGVPALHLKVICAVGTSLVVVAILALLLLRHKPTNGHRGHGAL
ncbi:MAG: TIGR03987 family protein [Eggerthellaceae bacterium]|nr:TIGR03987 family protein [Eggerthellaceae bacterium]